MPSAEQKHRPALIDNEHACIDAAQADPQTFGPLYEAYADLVWRYAMSRLGNTEQASDATSLTFTRALAALPGFVPSPAPTASGFRSWLMTIARNVVIDEQRRRQPSASLSDPAWHETLPDEQPSPEVQALVADERRQITAAIAQLSPVQRQIVECRLIGMTSAEIAATLEMSVSAVNTAHFRAYARLRDLLSSDHEETAP